MPEDNVWLRERRKERSALESIIAALDATAQTDQAVRGAGVQARLAGGPRMSDRAATAHRSYAQPLHASTTTPSTAPSGPSASSSKKAVRSRFKAVAEHAPCSTAFLYGHAELEATNHAPPRAAPARGAPVPPVDPDAPSSVVRTLTLQIAALKRRHRDEARAAATGPRRRTRRDPRIYAAGSTVAATDTRRPPERLNRSRRASCLTAASAIVAAGWATTGSASRAAETEHAPAMPCRRWRQSASRAHAGPAGLHARESRLDHDRRLVRGVVALQELTIATEVQRAYLGSGQTDQIAFMATFP